MADPRKVLTLNAISARGLARLCRVLGHAHLVTFVLQDLPHQLADIPFIVNPNG